MIYEPVPRALEFFDDIVPPRSASLPSGSSSACNLSLSALGLLSVLSAGLNSVPRSSFFHGGIGDLLRQS